METLFKNAKENTEKIGKVGGTEAEDIGNAKIVVVGSGGAGNNTIHRLEHIGVNGAQLIAVNTDKQHLSSVDADEKVLIGYEITKGLGAGGNPEIGEQAAMEAKPALKELLGDVDLVFITAGLGGGTGTGSLPIIAEVARANGALVVGAVTMPFNIERARIGKARAALEKLRENTDSVVVVDNNKLLEFVPRLPISEAFGVADEILSRMVKGITETISIPSLVNLDFADVRSVMEDGTKRGIAMIGLGESDTRNRAEEAVLHALENPLLEVDYRGATGALIHITGGEDLTLGEATQIGEYATKYLKGKANVIWGSRIDKEYNGRVQVMIIMTGVSSPDILSSSQGSRIQIPERTKAPYFSSGRKPTSQWKQKNKREVEPLMSDLGIDYIL